MFIDVETVGMAPRIGAPIVVETWLAENDPNWASAAPPQKQPTQVAARTTPQVSQTPSRPLQQQPQQPQKHVPVQQQNQQPSMESHYQQSNYPQTFVHPFSIHHILHLGLLLHAPVK